MRCVNLQGTQLLGRDEKLNAELIARIGENEL